MIVVDLDPDGRIDQGQFPDADFYLITPGQRENFIPAQMDQILRLENGLHVTVHRAEIRILRNQRYAFFDISTQMAGNADLPDSCLMLAAELLPAFPDVRSYVALNLDIGSQQMYDFPLCLVRNQVFQGYMAFPLPDDIRDFSLIKALRFYT